MNRSLTVDDPLAEQEVTIIITLAASEHPRDERPAMVSVGVAEQMPVIRTGRLGELSALIQQAWTTFGVRAQMVVAGAGGESVAEEQVVATASTEADESAPKLQPNVSTPKPQARNLSLF